MKKYYRIWMGVGVVLLVGAFYAFLMMSKTTSLVKALMIGLVYAICFGSAFWLVFRFLGNKLDVFTTGQQWILRTLLYTIAFVTAYVTGLVFQTLVLLPASTLEDILTRQLWQGLVSLVTLPIQRGSFPSFFDLEFRAVLIPFFTVVFLIGLVSLVGSFVQIRWQEHQQQIALQQAELAALRAQIEPHFLFNSLNTIASHIRSDPERAEHLLIQLSRMLRYLFQNTSRETIPLEREIEFTRQYLELLQARFGENLKVRWNQSITSLSQPAPVLLIQPLLENAIQHGWADRAKPLHLGVGISETDQAIHISVEDDGKGISPERLSRLPISGHALENVSERLYLTFQKKGLLNIRSREGGGTIVTITIPMRQ